MISLGKAIGVLVVCLFFTCLETGGQEKPCRRVVFYNVENLFDTRKDSVKADDDFTPRGKLYWTRERYHQKLLHVSRALIGAGEADLPDVIGLAEVEHRGVLEDLVLKTGLADGNYGIVHADSPDARGIDVALLYRRGCCRVLEECFYTVELEKGETTRDILHCKGVLEERDTFDFFVCHFPSMRGGEKGSEWKRVRAASLLRRKVDSVQACRAGAMIVIMGDMNGAANTTAQRVLGTMRPGVDVIDGARLYNMGYYLLGRPEGSYRYRGEWQTLDHIIVSGSLLDGRHAWQVGGRMEVYKADFLLEEERGAFGTRPKPTYRGMRYIGGYSDHLPVYVELRKN